MERFESLFMQLPSTHSRTLGNGTRFHALIMLQPRIFQVIDTRSAVKKIRLNSLSASTDLQALAQDVVDKCKLISQSKIATVTKYVKINPRSLFAKGIACVIHGRLGQNACCDGMRERLVAMHEPGACVQASSRIPRSKHLNMCMFLCLPVRFRLCLCHDPGA